MNIHPIQNDEDYRAALRDLSGHFDRQTEPGTPEGDQFAVMLTLVEAYETKQFVIEASDPLQAIRFRMGQAGLSAKDLVPSIGRLNRVHEVLNGKRQLTLPMIRRLRKNLGVPVESLLGA